MYCCARLRCAATAIPRRSDSAVRYCVSLCMGVRGVCVKILDAKRSRLCEEITSSQRSPLQQHYAAAINTRTNDAGCKFLFQGQLARTTQAATFVRVCPLVPLPKSPVHRIVFFLAPWYVPFKARSKLNDERQPLRVPRQRLLVIVLVNGFVHATHDNGLRICRFVAFAQALLSPPLLHTSLHCAALGVFSAPWME